MSRLFPRLLAVALPLVLLMSGLGSVTNYADTKEQDARRNAGHVLNGDKLETSTVEAIAARIQEQRPTVIVIGDSIANNAIAGKRLAEGLKLPSKKVLMLTIPGSISAHWYALLKHHVFATEHRPSLILVVSSMQSMLDPVPTSTAMKANLDALVTQDDAVLLKKAYPNALSRLSWHQLRTTKQDLRRDILTRARSMWVGLFWYDRSAEASREHQGKTKAHRAHMRVFKNENMDFSTLNVQATGSLRHNVTVERLSEPEQGFLPNLARIAAANNTRLLMVRAPLSPLIEPEYADVVPEGWTERARAVLARHNARLLDLGDMEVGVRSYRDPLHMTSRAKQRFTDVVAHHIARVRGHVEGVSWWNERFPPSESLNGEHLRAGQQTDMRFDVPWPGDGKRFRVQAKLSKITELGNTPPELHTADDSIKAKRFPNAWIFDGWLPLPERAPWTLTLKHPLEGDTTLDALTFGDVGHVSYVHGDSQSFKGPAVDIISAYAPPHANVSLTQERPPRIQSALEAAPQNMGVYAVPGFADIFDQLSLTDHDAATQCSPVHVLENGRPLRSRTATCARLRHEAPGQGCFDGDHTYFTSSDRRPPSSNDSQYRVALHPERWCGDAWWIYPGDTLTFAISADDTSDWEQRTRKLAISTMSSASSGGLDVVVSSQSGNLLEATVEAQPGTVRAGFVRRLAKSPTQQALRVTLHNPTSDRYFLVDHLALRP